MRTFVFSDGKSNKFWNVELRGTSFTVTFGRAGTAGQTQLKEFADEAAARKAHDKLVAEKLKKGYTETTPKAVTSPLALSMEVALVEDPDDLAAHMAYGDYLAEQGDPRGDFIQVQLALEDPARSAPERKKLRVREAELLALHGRGWLGEAGKFLVGDWSGPDKPWRYSFRRGWLDSVRMLPGPVKAIEILASAPESRLLSRLEIVYDMRYHPFDFGELVMGPSRALGIDASDASGEGWDVTKDIPVVATLLASPHLGNLRSLKLGFSDDEPNNIRHSTMVHPFRDCNAGVFIALLEKCPRLEELYLNHDVEDVGRLFASPALGHLRVLQYYFGHGRYGATTPDYPLSALAGNAALRNLRAVRLHPGRDAAVDLGELEALLASDNLPALEELQVHMTNYGDDGARAIARSGILRRLKRLDIGYGNMTDEGARLLADAEGVRRLESLDVSRNALTPAGVATLLAVVPHVVADSQQGEVDDDYYNVDVE